LVLRIEVIRSSTGIKRQYYCRFPLSIIFSY
jgi:hypothetical protein